MAAARYKAAPPGEETRAGRRTPGDRLAPCAEVRRVGRAVRVAALRRTRGDADPDLAEAAAEDVLAVRRAVHPLADDRDRRGVGAGAPRDVLADGPSADARQVAGVADAPDEVAVLEVVVAGHVLRVAKARQVQPAVLVQAAEPVDLPLVVEEAQR